MSDAVEVVGPVPFSEIGSYLSRSAMGWVPLQPIDKYQKNVPTKLFEYMAFGLPVVCSDLVGSRPFVEQGQSGYLVTADDPVAHASAILNLLKHEEQASEMGMTGRKLIEERYNWQRVEHKLLDLYETVLGN
jgi:glycosyltransferase involved in cell wall biosynthesis